MAPSINRIKRRPAAVSRRLTLAKAAIFAEDLLKRTWRGVMLLLVFAGLVLMGLWSWLPGVLHVLTLAVFVFAVPLAFWRDLRGVTWPDEDAALRRLESKSGFDHRPLLAIEDEFAGDMRDPQSQALFEAHRTRMLERIGAIRVGRPQSDVSSTDRLALRSVAIMVCALGLIAGWSRSDAHVAALFAPDFSSVATGGEAGELTFWITPPAYTGIPPLWLDALDQGPEGEAIAIPAGSELVAQVRGGDEAPTLSIDEKIVVFEPAGLGSYQVVHVFDGGSQFSVDQAGNQIAAWPIDVIQDEAPMVTLTAEPTETLRTSLRLDVLARDDYGLSAIHGTIRRTGEGRDDTEALEISVPLAQVGIADMQAPAFYNLMSHPWAGMDVSLVLSATDVTGQETLSQKYFFKMPERFFMHPVARQINDQRKLLVMNPNFAELTANMLEGLTLTPDAYLDDASVHLALVTGSKRLFYAEDEPEVARQAVTELMWDTALAIEEGPLAFAEQRVRDLQDQLLEALTEGASEQEIERLLDELRLAMDDYMRALSNRLRTDPGDLFDPTDALKAVGSRELTDLVEQIRELVRTGSHDQAQTLLTRLQEIMENISVGNLSDLTGNISAQAAEVIHTIRQLMNEQQELLDETFGMLRESENDEFETEDQSATQVQLQGVLQDLMNRMDEFGFESPREFSRADRSMGRAVRQLDADRPGQAVDHQTETLEYLRSGADVLMEQMMEQAGESATGDGQNFFAAPRDPMGRNMGGDGDSNTSDITLPDQGAIIRAREILDELYKRAGQQHRPLQEQEYLQRLLRRF